MWAPLIILALGAIFAGYLGVLWKAPGQAEGGWLQQFVAQSPSLAAALPMGERGAALAAHAGAASAGHEAGHLSPMVLFVLSLIIPIVGIAIAWYFHLKNRHAATVIGIGLRPLVKFLENRWYIDELYRHVITGGLWLLALVLASIDRFLVDGLVTVVGGLPGVVGYTLKPTQRGLLQRYAVGMVLGVGAIILGVIWIMR
jgi:NADH-quinone oxidoreductase subunit L